ncbi:MAG: UvrB/UvrC motif-containing protein, partial [Muribaculaceae bacterium]|nr:UvrB/UvrC motif-containing protein [Muribaculaceae bacterium]
FLRSHRSLTQTVGRAARNLNGEVIMYADKITDSMQLTIDETERRRAIQLAYNQEHGITPQAIVKARNAIVGLEREEVADEVTAKGHSRQLNARDKKQKARGKAAIPYAEEYSTSVDIAADPVIAYMNADELQRSINRMRADMVKAAKEMEFMTAARLRDEIIKMELKLESMRDK